MNETDWNPLSGTGWEPLLEQESMKEHWICLEKCIQQERSCFPERIYPPADKVFEALRLTHCTKTRVVIVGQDPYHRFGLADGLAFSVPRQVTRKKLPTSLRNILRALRDPDLPGEWRVNDAGHGNLAGWARRGALLLNTTLTVRDGVPGSHRGMGWETFTDLVITAVERASHPVFMLWGKQAQRKKDLLEHTPAEMIIESVHPRMPYFVESQPFSRAYKALKTPPNEPIWGFEE